MDVIHYQLSYIGNIQKETDIERNRIGMKCGQCGQELIQDLHGVPVEHSNMFERIVALKMKIMELEKFKKLVIDCGFAIYKEGDSTGLNIHSKVYFPDRYLQSKEES